MRRRQLAALPLLARCLRMAGGAAGDDIGPVLEAPT
jgi:hypothetical protein